MKTIRNLCLILGDQLNRDSLIFADFDPARDLLWMAEILGESTHELDAATRDAIRHWAHGIGDRNPFWAAERLAPPTILFAMDRIVSGYVGGLPGVLDQRRGEAESERSRVDRGQRADPVRGALLGVLGGGAAHGA